MAYEAPLLVNNLPERRTDTPSINKMVTVMWLCGAVIRVGKVDIRVGRGCIEDWKEHNLRREQTSLSWPEPCVMSFQKIALPTDLPTD